MSIYSHSQGNGQYRYPFVPPIFRPGIFMGSYGNCLQGPWPTRYPPRYPRMIAQHRPQLQPYRVPPHSEVRDRFYYCDNWPLYLDLQDNWRNSPRPSRSRSLIRSQESDFYTRTWPTRNRSTSSSRSPAPLNRATCSCSSSSSTCRSSPPHGLEPHQISRSGLLTDEDIICAIASLWIPLYMHSPNFAFGTTTMYHTITAASTDIDVHFLNAFPCVGRGLDLPFIIPLTLPVASNAGENHHSLCIASTVPGHHTIRLTFLDSAPYTVSSGERKAAAQRVIINSAELHGGSFLDERRENFYVRAKKLINKALKGQSSNREIGQWLTREHYVRKVNGGVRINTMAINEDALAEKVRDIIKNGG
ncbi:MAG: hypothetical protein M1834_006969 [Cirrosporium novae-zelandiae]|nr:MAG: hypothetical protein M1834_006969 [Cirrosporium novae-zelandiae]